MWPPPVAFCAGDTPVSSFPSSFRSVSLDSSLWAFSVLKLLASRDPNRRQLSLQEFSSPNDLLCYLQQFQELIQQVARLAKANCVSLAWTGLEHNEAQIWRGSHFSSGRLCPAHLKLLVWLPIPFKSSHLIA